MKKINSLIMILCLFLCVGCNNKATKEDIVDEGEKTPSVNLIISSSSKYFKESEFVDEENSPKGDYKQTYKYEDIQFTLERMKHKEYSKFPTYIKEKDIDDSKYNEETMKKGSNLNSSYKETKATYITNVDDKEIFNEDILISTDQWDFRVHFEVNNDDYSEKSSIIDNIVENIEIQEIS